MSGNKKIYGFWHIATIGPWQAIVERQFSKIISSGLYDASDSIFVSVVGAKSREDVPTALRIGKFVASSDPDLTRYEFATLQMLQQRALEEDCYCWYIHVKGVSEPGDAQSPRWRWREYMEYFVIENWRVCVQCLQDHDMVGAEWRTTPAPHYSGNFWWADACYLRQLPCLKAVERAARGDRYAAEYWICSRQPRVKCLHRINRDLCKAPVRRDEYAGYADMRLYDREVRRSERSREEDPPLRLSSRFRQRGGVRRGI